METQLLPLSCDDQYISLVLNVTDIDINTGDSILSDVKYAEELQLQEAIMASLNARQITPNVYLEESSKKVIGESSQIHCEICAMRKEGGQMFSVQNCTHQFCTECISKHISIIVKERSVILNSDKAPLFTCPGVDCKGVLEMDACREIVNEDVLSVWDNAICEALIDPSQRFYCPYKDCSALMVNECGEDTREAECLRCNRLICVQCNVPWHSGIDCAEFMRLGENERGKEDLMVHDLAKKNKWQRCPHCKFYVDRNEGCLHMTCRCRYQFCYACGAAWSSTHVCQR